MKNTYLSCFFVLIASSLPIHANMQALTGSLKKLSRRLSALDVNLMALMPSESLLKLAATAASDEEWNQFRIMLQQNPSKKLINQKDVTGKNVLWHVASAPNVPDDIIPMLLKLGADPNVKDEENFTPLMAAVQVDNAKSVRTILEKMDKQSMLNIKSTNGATALDIAEVQKNKEIIDMFQKAGAKKAEDLK